MAPPTTSNSTNPFASKNAPEKSTDSIVNEKPAVAEAAGSSLPEKPAQPEPTVQRIPEPASEQLSERAEISNEPVPVGAAPFEPAPSRERATDRMEAPDQPAPVGLAPSDPSPSSAFRTALPPAETGDEPTKESSLSNKLVETSPPAASAAVTGPGLAGSGTSATAPEPTTSNPANGVLKEVEMTDAPAAEVEAAPEPTSAAAEEPVTKPAPALASATPIKATADQQSESKVAPVTGEKRKADDLTQDEPAANGHLAATDKSADTGAKASPSKKLKMAADKMVDKAKSAINRAKAKREKKPAPAVGRTQRKTRSQGPVDA
jgi:hypothetical protein